MWALQLGQPRRLSEAQVLGVVGEAPDKLQDDLPRKASTSKSSLELDFEFLFFQLEFRNGILLHQIDNGLDIL